MSKSIYNSIAKILTNLGSKVTPKKSEFRKGYLLLPFPLDDDLMNENPGDGDSPVHEESSAQNSPFFDDNDFIRDRNTLKEADNGLGLIQAISFL
jgi:hypothetical protein